MNPIKNEPVALGYVIYVIALAVLDFVPELNTVAVQVALAAVIAYLTRSSVTPNERVGRD